MVDPHWTKYLSLEQQEDYAELENKLKNQNDEVEEDICCTTIECCNDNNNSCCSIM